MSQDRNHYDLTDQLNLFSISSQEERLAQQLNQAHITSSKSIFSVPTINQQQHVNNNNHNTNFNTQSVPPVNSTWDTQSTPQWDSNAPQHQPTSNGDDGWGEGPPSYTSISQGTYFGFNSIMDASQIAGIPTTNTSLSPAGEKAFGRFKNTPVTFTSAAAAFNTDKNK